MKCFINIFNCCSINFNIKIKRFGIKKTNYFTDAFNKTFKTFEVDMVEAAGRDIVITFNRLNKRK